MAKPLSMQEQDDILSANSAALVVLKREVQGCKELENERWQAHLREQGLLERFTDQFRDEMGKRLETMNEFRSSLKDQAAQFFTKQEHAAFQKLMSSEVESIKEDLVKTAANCYTRVEHDAYKQLVENDLRFLRESRSELAGKASQSSANWAFATAILAVLCSLLGTAIALFRHG